MIFLEHVKVLVNLALIDGNMAEREKEYIKNIANAHDIPESSTETLFYSSHEIVIPQKLTPDQKFEFAFTLIQLMKIDERLYPDEIKFCANIIEKLGYQREVITELLLQVSSDPRELSHKEGLKKRVNSFLISR